LSRPGWGSNPGSFYFIYFLIPSLDHGATAAPCSGRFFKNVGHFQKWRVLLKKSLPLKSLAMARLSAFNANLSTMPIHLYAHNRAPAHFSSQHQIRKKTLVEEKHKSSETGKN
jgi:hypothetical protein